jgi:murein DD-endopeptidase MepM/ murein hydrolase activator NlpD
MAKSVRSAMVLLVLLAVAAGLGAGLFMLYRDTQGPLLAVTPATGPVSPQTSVSVQADDEASALRALTVRVVQEGASTTLLERVYSPARSSVSEPLDLSGAGLDDGPFIIEVRAVDASWAGFGKGNAADLQKTLELDATPPRLSVQSGQHNIKPGGSGCIVYTVSEPVSRSGVTVGEHFFPGYAQADGRHVALFAFPFDMEEADFSPRLTAEDVAGNQRERRFNYHVSSRSFRSDVLNLPDSFLERKMPDFETIFPGEMTPLERFLKVNGELRKKNRAQLLHIGRETGGAPVWEGAFIRMAGANRAGFGDRRTYKYNGEVVDNQTHLGIDLASVRNDEVPAANTGKVVFADYLGIYGNVVIIDHGLGLQSLHAHLSEIAVQEGDMVKKGQTVGKTGMSGLAGGDHLHFAVLVSGMPVTPVEWWDAHWIQDNVADRL